jgi:IS30 family transposase
MAREYFPKGMDSTPISETYMQHVFTELNLRLQTCWGYKTPYEVCH